MRKKIVAIVASVLCFFSLGFGQETTTSPESENTLNVFIDGQFVDDNYLREEFPFVNYVRTRESADVHVLAAMSMTGAGRQYEFYFMGLKDLAGKTDTLSYFSNGQTTTTEAREGYTKILKMGLIRYMALADHVVDFSIQSEAPRGGEVVMEDPWDSWVFELDARGSFSGVETRKTQSYEAGLDITRVTPNWRHEYRINYDNSAQEYTSDDYYSLNKTIEASFDMLTVKSLGPNAGVGILGHAEQNTRDNYDLNAKLSAAVEYNFFPYEMSSRRQLSVGYYIGLDYRDYIDSTAYEVIEELISYEMVSLGYSQREQWGNVYASASFSHFFRDFSENNLSITGGLNVRIWKGLSWNLSGSFSIINDDVNISMAEVSPEDLLLGVRRLSTEQSYSINTGFSFTFGSMYNNVVNTRLKGMTMNRGGGGGGGYR